MENTKNETAKQLNLNVDFKAVNKDLKSSHQSLQDALIEQNVQIAKSEKIFVKLAIASADIIYFMATKGYDLKKTSLSLIHLPLYSDVEQQLLTVVKNLCTHKDEVDEERLAKLKGSFQTALRCAYLVVGQDTGYQFGVRKDATSRADKGILDEKAIEKCKKNGTELVDDCFYIPSKTFKNVIDKDAGKDSNGDWKTRPNTDNLTIATRSNIDDSYSKFILHREMADNNAEFKKVSNPRNHEKNETVVMPESYENYKKLVINFINDLVDNLPTNDQNESNKISSYLEKEKVMMEKGEYPTFQDKDGTIKNQLTVLQLLKQLADTIDTVLINAGNEEKTTDIIQGDLKTNEKTKAEKLAQSRLAQNESSKAKKQPSAVAVEISAQSEIENIETQFKDGLISSEEKDLLTANLKKVSNG
tara:strand:- start:247 stop:1497 length:1251 start_codon:yes stop_codon:yes gene_type:complete